METDNNDVCVRDVVIQMARVRFRIDENNSTPKSRDHLPDTPPDHKGNYQIHQLCAGG